MRVHNLTWCRPCLTMATRAARSRDAEESSTQDTYSEDESSTSEEENEESVESIDADSNGGNSDRPQQEEGAGSSDLWPPFATQIFPFQQFRLRNAMHAFAL